MIRRPPRSTLFPYNDALPILASVDMRVLGAVGVELQFGVAPAPAPGLPDPLRGDRKSTRLNSSHSQISYAVFCLKKKKEITLQVYCYFHTCVSTTELPYHAHT